MPCVVRLFQRQVSHKVFMFDYKLMSSNYKFIEQHTQDKFYKITSENTLSNLSDKRFVMLFDFLNLKKKNRGGKRTRLASVLKSETTQLKQSAHIQNEKDHNVNVGFMIWEPANRGNKKIVQRCMNKTIKRGAIKVQ